MPFREMLSSRPVLYEVVPPKLGSPDSEIQRRIELLEGVLHDRRIDAINIPELMERREADGLVSYIPTTITPEEYAALIGGSKEKVVNMVAPRLAPEQFTRRVSNLASYGIRDLVVVGKARKSDNLPGRGVIEALDQVTLMNDGRSGKKTDILLGGICIFDRNRKTNHGYVTTSEELNEHERVAIKARHGCRFVTSQISFDSKPPLEFLAKYAALCQRTKERPVTVFISLSTIKTPGILSLLTEKLEVRVPDAVKKRLQEDPDRMGRTSIDASTEFFSEMVESIKTGKIGIPIGLHIEQVGVGSADLSLELLDRTYPLLKSL